MPKDRRRHRFDAISNFSRAQCQSLERRTFLSGTAAGVVIPEDRFEPNDFFLEAAELGSVADRTEADLTIHDPNNQDWYSFTAAESGQYVIDILFKHAQGDLDATLYGDNQSQILDQSQSEDNDEQLTAFLTAGDEYVIQVFGFAGAVSPDYDIVIDAPGGGGDVIPPAVTGVFVSSTAWSANFLNSVQNSGAGESAFGYRLDAAAHADELPWVNLNKVSIRFSEDVLVGADDLTVRGVTNLTYPLAASNNFTYDAATFTATWTLATSGIINDRLLLDLSGAPGGVSDPAGNSLDGEWTNPTPPNTGGADTFPSGDGTEGGDFEFRINVLPGDANRSGGSVIGSDVTLVRNAQNSSPGGVGSLYTIFKDVNGSNTIVGSDVTNVRNRQGLSLPAGNPGLVAGLRMPATPAASAAGLFSATPIPTLRRDLLAPPLDESR